MSLRAPRHFQFGVARALLPNFTYVLAVGQALGLRRPPRPPSTLQAGLRALRRPGACPTNQFTGKLSDIGHSCLPCRHSYRHLAGVVSRGDSGQQQLQILTLQVPDQAVVRADDGGRQIALALL